MDVAHIAETGRGAGILLLELVAVDRIVQRVGEIGEQVQLVAEDVGLEAVLRTPMAMAPIGGPGNVARVPTVGRIHVAPRRKRAGLDERERDLVARAPFALVETQRRREAVVAVAARPGQLAVGTTVVIAHQPRSVGVGALRRVKQVTRPRLHRIRDQYAAMIE
jgi:hypothetical protein